MPVDLSTLEWIRGARAGADDIDRMLEAVQRNFELLARAIEEIRMTYIPTAGVGASLGAAKLVSAAYTATLADELIEVTCTTANIPITLPATTGSGHRFTVKKVDATAFAAQMVPVSGDTIEGKAGTFNIAAQGTAITIEDVAPGKWDIV